MRTENPDPLRIHALFSRLTARQSLFDARPANSNRLAPPTLFFGLAASSCRTIFVRKVPVDGRFASAQIRLFFSTRTRNRKHHQPAGQDDGVRGKCFDFFLLSSLELVRWTLRSFFAIIIHLFVYLSVWRQRLIAIFELKSNSWFVPPPILFIVKLASSFVEHCPLPLLWWCLQHSHTMKIPIRNNELETCSNKISANELETYEWL